MCVGVWRTVVWSVWGLEGNTGGQGPAYRVAAGGSAERETSDRKYRCAWMCGGQWLGVCGGMRGVLEVSGRPTVLRPEGRRSGR